MHTRRQQQQQGWQQLRPRQACRGHDTAAPPARCACVVSCPCFLGCPQQPRHVSTQMPRTGAACCVCMLMLVRCPSCTCLTTPWQSSRLWLEPATLLICSGAGKRPLALHIALVPRLRCQQPWHNNRSWICDCSTFRQLDRLASLLVVIVDAVGCFDPAFDSTECCLTQHGTIDRSIAGVFVNGRLQSSNAMPISHRHQLSTMLRLVCSAGGLCAAGAAHSVGHRLALSRLGEQAGAAPAWLGPCQLEGDCTFFSACASDLACLGLSRATHVE